MTDVRVLVVRAAGINCDEEVMHAWRLAGATPTSVHINALAQEPSMLNDCCMVTIPGGFSYGDDIAAGVILARRLQDGLADHLHAFVQRGGGILGICNGFQVLVKMGLLPGGEYGRNQVTVTFNDSARFEARWVRLKVCTSLCPYLKKDDFLELPVEHAEGKVVTADDTVSKKLQEGDLIALRYVDAQGRYDVYPANPNGSTAGIAGLCDATGRVFGLMPHPDRHFDPMQHPQWTRRQANQRPDGLTIFQNAVRFWNR